MLSGTLLHPRPAMSPVRQSKFTDNGIRLNIQSEFQSERII